MCEHCDDPALKAEAWEPIEEAAGKEAAEFEGDPDWPGCEFENDLHGGPWGDGPGGVPEPCPEPATWVRLSTYPYEHLCQAHKEAQEAYLVEEYGGVPEVYGLEGVATFQEIGPDASEPCEELDPETLSDCAAPARWVVVGTFELFACREHHEVRGERSELRL